MRFTSKSRPIIADNDIQVEKRAPMTASLILVSGLLSDEGLWQGQISALGPVADVRIVCPTQSNPESMVEKVLENAPSHFALAGHSMGGWLALEVMRRVPHRVVKLCLINTTSREDDEEKRGRRENMIKMVREGQFQEVILKFADRFVYRQEVMPDVLAMFERVGSDAFIRQQESMLKRREVISILPTIACPTLVVHAAEDRNFSLEEHKELAEAIPGARLSVIEQAGHMSPMEKPEEVGGLLREWFLEAPEFFLHKSPRSSA